MKIDPAYPFATIVNFAKGETAARSTARRFNSILSHFMDRKLPFLGYVPYAEAVSESISRQQPVTTLYPDSLVTQEFQYIAQTLSSISQTDSASLAGNKNLPLEITN
jgi:MinD-like ATPase involved in chromosome partitioning or flagellar assembly